jgi:uncharacterized membrane protein (TIGR02234 family)
VAEPEPGARPPLRARLTSRSSTFAALLLGGLLAVVSTAQPWWRALGSGAQVVFKGTEATGGLSQALAVVSLAGTLLVLVLRVRGRQVLAVLLGLTGAGIVLVGALRLRPTGDAVRTKLAEVSLISQYALTATAWPWVFALAGLLVVLGAVALLLGAPSWSVGAARFDRRTVDPLESVDDDPAALWKAQDAGLDPTSGPEGSPDDRPGDPNVQIGDPGDTMVPNKREDHQRPDQREPDRTGSDRRVPTRRPTSAPE